MFDTSALLAFTLACFALAIVPGPNITVIIATALQRGPTAGIAVVTGTQIGIFSQVLVIALGFEAIIGIMGWVFDWLKLLGAAYLLYLGFMMVRSSGNLGSGKALEHLTYLQLVLRGFLVNWSNPKTLMFIGAFIPQFVNSALPAFPQIMVFGLIFVAVTTLVDGAYGLLAGSAGKIISQSRVKMLSRVSGVILMAGGVWLASQQKT